MKKIVLLVLALLLIPVIAFAEGSVTVSKTTVNGGDIEIISFAFIANASGAATVPATSSSSVYPGDKAGYIIKVVTDPGATAPTDDYDITLVDSTTNADLLGGEGSNRDTANSEEAVPKIGNAYAANLAPVAFTLNLTGNSVNSATGTVYVYIAK
jgi:hypothetical protein